MIVTATTTDPVKGTTTVDRAVWYRVDEIFMLIRWDYQQSGAGSAGNGTYLFAIPEGYTIDTRFLEPVGAEESLGVCGNFCSEAGTVTYVGHVGVYDTTHLYCMGGNEVSSPTKMGGATGSMSASDRTYSFFAKIPILEWS
jgi:hypothetical protein